MSIGYFQWTKIGCFRWTRSGSFRRTLTFRTILQQFFFILEVTSCYIIKLSVLLYFGSLLTSITVSDIFITVTVIRRQVLCGTMRKVVRSQR